ncbi:four helix bundle protein [candidate division KSB1 bacterium]|nr:four helix bundle protein [candidate division KSB1 bacterium]NIR69811.1 four helix bundle protein [candidate division KSB1 bacterium]NIS25801.1 four helix bundle protein [candidate division KSB1 bacterium]NIT72675.1 four helix bundle protein [candidate division KSB1 bacterium]NIU26490.1 four helix bundle protein [candidate division KSB1 bacterium]
MATFKSFEEIEAWQKARELTREIYEITKNGAFAKDFELKRQIRRAAISIMSNVAEGFERSGTVEFIHFLSIARGSAGEVKAQLYIAKDQRYISPEDFNRLTSLASETSRMIAGLMNYLKKSNFKGTKFKSA